MKYSAGLALKQIYKIGKRSLRIHQQSNGSFKGGSQPVSYVVFTGPCHRHVKGKTECNIHSCSADGKHTHTDCVCHQTVQSSVQDKGDTCSKSCDVVWLLSMKSPDTPNAMPRFMLIHTLSPFLGPMPNPHLQSQACFLMPKRPWSSSDVPSPRLWPLPHPWALPVSS